MPDRSLILAVFAFQHLLLDKEKLLIFLRAGSSSANGLDSDAIEALTPLVDQFLAGVGDISDQRAIASLPLAEGVKAEILGALQPWSASPKTNTAQQHPVARSTQKESSSTPAVQVLTGMVAFQNNFISRQQLIDAFTEWVAHPDIALCEFMVRQGSLGRSCHRWLAFAQVRIAGDG